MARVQLGRKNVIVNTHSVVIGDIINKASIFYTIYTRSEQNKFAKPKVEKCFESLNRVKFHFDKKLKCKTKTKIKIFL